VEAEGSISNFQDWQKWKGMEMGEVCLLRILTEKWGYCR